MGTVDVVIGRVVLVHIRDEVIGPDGRPDLIKIRPLGRLGYYDYTTVDSLLKWSSPGTMKICSKGWRVGQGRRRYSRRKMMNLAKNLEVAAFYFPVRPALRGGGAEINSCI